MYWIFGIKCATSQEEWNPTIFNEVTRIKFKKQTNKQKEKKDKQKQNTKRKKQNKTKQNSTVKKGTSFVSKLLYFNRGTEHTCNVIRCLKGKRGHNSGKAPFLTNKYSEKQTKHRLFID